MRASKKKQSDSQSCYENSIECSRNEIHISGAEGLYIKAEITKAVEGYVKRAFEHPRGKPDCIVLTIEEIRQKPRRINSLPLHTVNSTNVRDARSFAKKSLQGVGISDAAIDSALDLVSTGSSMRGAALIIASSGKRIEPNRERGIRVSRIGISRPADTKLRQKLTRLTINTDTVREALVLASKVAACRPVIAELCVSDDPDYTTGYIASETLGYLRIPHIKKKKARTGGRVFFIHTESDKDEIIEYLEEIPVMVSTIAPCYGIFPSNGDRWPHRSS
jgi:6-carboxyhexanoate--CoA ligase